MSDSARDLLIRGLAAAKGTRPQDKQEARFYLQWVLDTFDADFEERQKANLELALLEEDPAKRRGYLGAVLAIDPSNAEARRELAILDGKLRREDIVDAKVSEAPQSPSAQARPRRYV